MCALKLHPSLIIAKKGTQMRRGYGSSVGEWGYWMCVSITHTPSLPLYAIRLLDFPFSMVLMSSCNVTTLSPPSAAFSCHQAPTLMIGESNYCTKLCPAVPQILCRVHTLEADPAVKMMTPAPWTILSQSEPNDSWDCLPSLGLKQYPGHSVSLVDLIMLLTPDHHSALTGWATRH